MNAVFDMTPRNDASLSQVVVEAMRRSIRWARPTVTAVSPQRDYDKLADTFEQGKQYGLPMTIIVVRVTNQSRLHEQHADASQAELCRSISDQLQRIFGKDCDVSPIGDQQHCVLLRWVDQLPDLVPMLENALLCASCGQHSRDDRRLLCNAGVARSELDAEDLEDLVSMASRAAAELTPSGPTMQFVTNRHRRHLKAAANKRRRDLSQAGCYQAV